MLKKIILIFGVLVSCTLLFLFAHSNFGFNPNYTIGVIKTNAERFDSAISYYDENLNLLYTRKLFLCDLTCFGDCFVDLGKKKYMLSRGTYWIPCRDAIELDASTGEIKKYDIGIGHSLDMTANDKYIFTTCSAFDAIINRCDKRTGELKKMTVPGSCQGMCADENNILYVFGGDSHRLISNLYIIDAEKMEVLKTFDIRDRGYYQEQCMKIGDDLYFLNYIRFRWKGDFNGEPCHTLTKFNTKTYEFQDIEIGKKPLQLVKSDNYLYITYSYRDSEPVKLTVYNIKDGNLKTYELSNDNAYIAIDSKNKKLYSTAGMYINQYELPSLKLLKRIDSLGKDREKYSTRVIFTK